MSAKRILFDQEARDGIRRGVRKLARAVKVTLGPRGRTVMIEKSWGAPVVTKDGVTVAKEIDLQDPYENVGARMVREVAQKTNDTSGDGTTTATILAEAIYEEGLKNVTAGANGVLVGRGIEKAVQAVVEKLRKLSKKVDGSDEIAQIGAIAANGDAEIGRMIAEAMEKVGKDGVITIEEGKSLETTVEWVEGMQFDKGYLSPHFITDFETVSCVLEDPYILVHEKKISSLKDLIPIIEKVSKSGKPILIVAEDLEGDALATLVINKLRGTFSCCAAKTPGFGDRRKAMLQDIATLTGARAIFEDLGLKLENLELADLGRAKRVIIDKDSTLIIEGAGKTDDIRGRIAQIRKEIESSTSDYDREKLEERLAKLAGGVAKVQVGAATESEMKEKKMRVEDALQATRAAVDEGIVAGGGVAYLRCLDVLDGSGLSGDEKVGFDIVRRALSAPIRTLATNAGVDGSVICERVKESKGNQGYDALSGNFVDMLQAGIIDPTKVARCALENAASVAALLLTTEAVIAEIPEKKPEPVGAGASDDY